jgi:hypothetical protein
MFALLLADRGIDVVGVDPAEASVAVARAKQPWGPPDSADQTCCAAVG